MVDEVLVTGATGTQGSGVVAALLREKIKVRALVRDRTSSRAKALELQGASLAQGEFDDRDSLMAATEGVDGVFSVQPAPGPKDQGLEVRAGQHLVEAARAHGVSVFVHTSVARADEHESFAGWSEGRWWPTYWTSKSEVNSIVRSAGFDTWTILKPAFMMDNWIPPKAATLFPTLSSGSLRSAMAPGTALDLISARDIGRVAGRAFVDPLHFHDREIPLATDSLHLADIARVIQEVTGKHVEAKSVDFADAKAAGIHPGIAQSQDWLNAEGYQVDLAAAAEDIGEHADTFRSWAEDHRDDFVVDGA